MKNPLAPGTECDPSQEGSPEIVDTSLRFLSGGKKSHNTTNWCHAHQQPCTLSEVREGSSHIFHPLSVSDWVSALVVEWRDGRKESRQGVKEGGMESWRMGAGKLLSRSTVVELIWMELVNLQLNCHEVIQRPNDQRSAQPQRLESEAEETRKHPKKSVKEENPC
ncbi:hypothetical protein INR49_029452 [Caranx melampygus]|nr:hypothetical protein INR49_029452 [Caranx melampygus]